MNIKVLEVDSNSGPLWKKKVKDLLRNFISSGRTKLLLVPLSSTITQKAMQSGKGFFSSSKTKWCKFFRREKLAQDNENKFPSPRLSCGRETRKFFQDEHKLFLNQRTFPQKISISQ
jgi:hypothetical protein